MFQQKMMVEIEAEDWKNMKTTIKIISRDIVKNYKTLKVTTAITPKEHGDRSHVKWTVESDPKVSIATSAYLSMMIFEKLSTFRDD